MRQGNGMKLPPLQSLLPNKGMTLVIMVLALLVGWYFYHASSNADHLIKRNFNSLNQIGANIDASISSARQIGSFNRKEIWASIYGNYKKSLDADQEKYNNCVNGVGPLCKNSILSPLPANSDRILEKSITTALEELRSRIVDDGYLASSSKDISIEVLSKEGPLPNGKRIIYPVHVCENELGQLSDIAAVYLEMTLWALIFPEQDRSLIQTIQHIDLSGLTQ